jgi:hypothetical protein
VGRDEAGMLPLVLNSMQVEATRVVTFSNESMYLAEEIEDSWGCTIGAGVEEGGERSQPAARHIRKAIWEVTQEWEL